MAWVVRTIMMVAIRSGTALVILAVLALAGGLAPPASGGAPAVGITYEDDSLSITTTADRTGILRVKRLDASLNFPGYHFDPAKPINSTIRIVGFRIFRDYRVSSVTETEMLGTVTTVACVPGLCLSDTDSFLLSGPVDTSPDPGDLLFTGTVSSGGTITVTMRGFDVTSFILEGVPLEPCTEPDNPLDIHAFDFPVLVERGEGNYLKLSLVQLQPHLTGSISFCDLLFPWTAEPVLPPTATPPPVTPTPPPTATPTPTLVPPTPIGGIGIFPGVPGDGAAAGAPTDDASNTLPVAFAIAGALLLGGGLFAARRRA